MTRPSTVDQLKVGDHFYVYTKQNLDPRLLSESALLDYIQENITLNLTLNPKPQSQYASPTSGATVQVINDSNDTHLILTPAATLASLTIALPAVGNLADKQEVLVTSTQPITTLTIDGNGASDIFSPAISMVAGSFFKLKYDQILSIWNRSG